MGRTRRIGVLRSLAPSLSIVSILSILSTFSIFSVLSTLAGCSGFGFLNGVTPVGRSLREAGISYGEGDRRLLDVYRPGGKSDPAPIVIFFYGGSWQWGDRGDYRFVGRALAAEGFLAIVPDYRVWPPDAFPAFLEDGAHVVRWARNHAGRHGGDPERIFVMGHSAGGHIAAMLALDERWLAAVGLDAHRDLRGMVGLAGPYDFLPLKDPKLKELFGPEAELPATQPVNFVGGDEAPILLLHGLVDITVGSRNTKRLAARIREKGGRVEEVLYPHVGHAGMIAALAGGLRFYAPVLSDVAAFVRERSVAP